jgi:hypothetical protein
VSDTGVENPGGWDAAGAETIGVRHRFAGLERHGSACGRDVHRLTRCQTPVPDTGVENLAAGLMDAAGGGDRCQTPVRSGLKDELGSTLALDSNGAGFAPS